MEYVTPYAGVWIEIYCSTYLSAIPQSLPTRECGLKLFGMMKSMTS